MTPAFAAHIARAARLATAVVVLVLTAATGAPAEPVYSFEATPGKLPKTVVPTHYAIELEPSLESLTFAGTELVDIEVREPTNRLVLNALNLALIYATIDELQARLRRLRGEKD